MFQLREVLVEFDFIVHCCLPSNAEAAESNQEDGLKQLAASQEKDSMDHLECDSRIYS